MSKAALTAEQSHTLKTLEAERSELNKRLVHLEGEVEYLSGMIGIHNKEIEEIELKIQDLSQSIIALDNA